MKVILKGESSELIHTRILKELGYTSVPSQEKNGIELGLYEIWEGITVISPIARDMILFQKAGRSNWKQDVISLASNLGIDLEFA